jgi:deoxyribodipyrimidine photo-lyase
LDLGACQLLAAYQHAPWGVPQAVLDDAEIELGRDYPRPIVDHAAARLRALEAFKCVSKSALDGDEAMACSRPKAK